MPPRLDKKPVFYIEWTHLWIIDPTDWGQNAADEPYAWAWSDVQINKCAGYLGERRQTSDYIEVPDPHKYVMRNCRGDDVIKNYAVIRVAEARGNPDWGGSGSDTIVEFWRAYTDEPGFLRIKIESPKTQCLSHSDLSRIDASSPDGVILEFDTKRDDLGTFGNFHYRTKWQVWAWNAGR
jgi:hypothetical protein